MYPVLLYLLAHSCTLFSGCCPYSHVQNNDNVLLCNVLGSAIHYSQGYCPYVMSSTSVFCDYRDLVLPARYARLFWEEREPAIGFDPSVFKAELPLPPTSELQVPVFVLGAEKDRTVDQQAFRETAEWYNVQPVIIPQLAHDVMLVSHAS